MKEASTGGRLLIDIKMEAERRGGRLLIEMAERGERHSGRGHTKTVGSRGATPRQEPKLADLGLSKTESSRWQSVARLPAAKWLSKKRHVTGIAVIPPPPTVRAARPRCPKPPTLASARRA